MVRGSKIDGIVTRSDLLKLPVRMLAFARIIHLELTMTAVINASYGDSDEWVALLSSQVKTLYGSATGESSSNDVNCLWWSWLDLSDKCIVLGKLLDLNKSAREQLDGVRLLRNKVAHAQELHRRAETLQWFLQRMRWTADLDHEDKRVLRIMTYKKKLIEVALPLRRHQRGVGPREMDPPQPLSTLHLWWARHWPARQVCQCKAARDLFAHETIDG